MRVPVIVGIAGAMAVGGWLGVRAIPLRGAKGGSDVAAGAGPRIAQASIMPPLQMIPSVAGADEKPAPAKAGPADLTAAKGLIAGGKLFEARAALTPLILAAPEGPKREEMRRLLEGINKDIFFSRAPAPDCEMHTLQPGDALALIVKKYGKDVHYTRLVMQINGIQDATKIQAGKSLKIPKGTFSAVVQKGAHRLVILFNGQYIKEYPVSVGAPASPTPEGQFALENNKAINPPWTAPDHEIYKFGDPKNILGTRWMGFRNTDKHQGYGIHGTNDPASIGQNVSNGCIRMNNADVEEVFSMLMPGDTVEVQK
jgi:lipoprotein-anchoring transpeptidase ErfK/SrfK